MEQSTLINMPTFEQFKAYCQEHDLKECNGDVLLGYMSNYLEGRKDEEQ